MGASGYISALEAAGAKVLDYEAFGSYQGDWFALVDHKGEVGFVHGAYGSCSGCDAFEADISYHYWDDDLSDSDKEKMLADFGEPYLDPLMTYDETVEYAGRHAAWDMEAEDMVKWVKTVWENHTNKEK